MDAYAKNSSCKKEKSCKREEVDGYIYLFFSLLSDNLASLCFYCCCCRRRHGTCESNEFEAQFHCSPDILTGVRRTGGLLDVRHNSGRFRKSTIRLCALRWWIFGILSTFWCVFVWVRVCVAFDSAICNHFRYRFPKDRKKQQHNYAKYFDLKANFLSDSFKIVEMIIFGNRCPFMLVSIICTYFDEESDLTVIWMVGVA